MKKNIAIGIFIIILSVFLIVRQIIKYSTIFSPRYINKGVVGILVGVFIIYFGLKNSKSK